jgi:L-aminopeptidase/D-esterase-like protein
MKYLQEKQIGFRLRDVVVPIVPAAILFDLGMGKTKAHPDAEMGYLAVSNAQGGPVREGNAGAGMGASVGKIFGKAGAMKSGLGTASLEFGGGVLVGAIVAVNAFGDVVDPASGRIVAGARPASVGPLKLGGEQPFADTLKVMKTTAGRVIMNLAGGNTTIGVVATNAAFNKTQMTKLAQMAQDGIARAIRPAHTMLDGDTVFALSAGTKKADLSTVGALAAEVLSIAILRAVRNAKGAGGLPAVNP